MAIAVPPTEDHDAARLSPADFRAKCTEGGGPCSVEMGQENVIALLLQQQEEVLREIRDQKKELALSQKNKQEIARLVLSSLKKQRLYKLPATIEPSHDPPLGQHSTRRAHTAPKRTSKKRAISRRRRRHSRSSRDLEQYPQSPQLGVEPPYKPRLSSDQNRGSYASAVAERSHFALDSVGKPNSLESGEGQGQGQHATTLIRQRVEKQAEHVEVSLDGAWLPSLSPALGLGSPGAAAGGRHFSSDDGASPVGVRSSSAAASHPVAMLPSSPYHASTPNSLHAFDARGRFPGSSGVRPGTVDSEAPKGRVLSHHLKQNEEDVVRTGSHPDLRQGLVHDGLESRGARAVEEITPLADIGDDDGRTGPSIEAFARDIAGGTRSDPAAVPKNISQDTATMLKRSQALVARAKAYCGQAARSSTADHGQRGGHTDSRLPPRCQTSDNSPSSGGRRGESANSLLAGSDGGGGTGEAGGILFAPSPWPAAGGSFSALRPLGEVKEEEGESPFSPPASAGAAGGGARERCTAERDAGMLESTAPAKIKIGGIGTGSLPQHLESERQAAASSGEREKMTTESEPLQVQRESVEAVAMSVGGVQGRRCSGSNISKVRKRRGEAVGGPKDEDEGNNNNNPAKVDTEWENEIAKNILSLYQTKLKADLDMKRDAEDEERSRRRRYLTIEEEEEQEGGSLFERQQQQQQRQRCSNRASTATTCNEEPHGSPKPRTAAAATSSTSGKPQGLECKATASETTTPARVRGKGANAATSSPSSRRAATAPTKPREVVVGRDYSLGRQPLPPPDAAPGAPGAAAPEKTARDPAKAAAAGAGRGGFRGNKAIVVQTRGGGEAVVVVPKRPRPIWFAGSGAIQAEWSALPGGARVARDLEGLEEQGRYSKYVAVVEGLLTAHLRADDQRGPGELVKKLWRQLVATCIAFGVRSTDQRRFERALELLKRAGVLLSRQVLDKRESQELKAFVHDAYGLYFLRRGKSSAALDYVQKAMKTHSRMRDWGHVAKCHLHSSVVLSKLNRHDEALRCLGQVLCMVQDGKLDVGGNSPQKLCLVAICYHNMAVEQLILRHSGEACMSSQNARRLARLCLSYSNRWLHSFEGTHKLALAELARTLPTAGGGTGAHNANGQRGSGGVDETEQGEILKRLTEELFS